MDGEMETKTVSRGSAYYELRECCVRTERLGGWIGEMIWCFEEEVGAEERDVGG